MGKILVIAEKPSVGRDYARVLGCKGQGDGCLIGDRYVVTWAVGHLIELSQPEVYDPRYKKWVMADLPIMPATFKHAVIPSSAKQFAIVKSWMNSSDIDSIICGTDSGREGELIFRYIYYMAGCKKPFERLWVSSMTEEAITAGFNSLKAGSEYDKLYQSAKCRSEADWLVGINGSRAFSLKNDANLSVGRVQTPTLAMIVNRQAEIDDFVPKDYYEVRLEHEASLKHFESVYFTLDEDGKTRNMRLDREEEAKAVLDRALALGSATVNGVTKTHKKELPPQLYDLTELQREGNRRYSFSANKVLDLAQALYEKHKLLTYPRTDSRYLSDDMKAVIPNTLKAVTIPETEAWINGLPPLVFSKRIVDNTKITDHHAIIPTNKRPNLSQLSEDEKKIYMLVVKRLIEVFYPAYEYDSTEAVLAAGSDLFLARGRAVTELGFKALSEKSGADKEDEDEKELPPLRKGQSVPITDGRIEKKQTQPPKPYTEATLLTAMEYAGKYIEDEELREKMSKLSLGTPATRAAIIERLLKVGYIVRKGKALFPTDKGKELIRIVPYEVKSPEMTGKWEHALERIYAGDMDADRFMDSIRRYVLFIVNAAENSKAEKARFGTRGGSYGAKSGAPSAGKKEGGEKEVASPRENFGVCPLCGKGQILLNRKAYYCSGWREGCKLTLWTDALDRYGAHLDGDTVKALAEKKTVEVKVVRPQTLEKGTMLLFVNDKGQAELKEFRAEPAPKA